MILYQFPISHYCEKVRWALDWKGIDFEVVNLLPGQHVFVTKKMGQETTLPILKNGETIIQDSTHIIDYLDSMQPNRVLTPTDTTQSLIALEWEEYFDAKVGIHLRRFFYFYILPQTKLAKQLILHDASPTAKQLYYFLFPIVRLAMKKGMNITEKTALRSRDILNEALNKLNDAITKSPSGYLVGDSFSRADLAAASLLAPLCIPPENPFPWPDQNLMPQELIAYRDSVLNQPFYSWVLSIYKKHRQKAPQKKS